MRAAAAACGLLAVGALLLLAASPAAGEVYSPGLDVQPNVLVLVEKLGEEQMALVDHYAETLGAAVGMEAGAVFTNHTGNYTQQLMAAMTTNGFEAARPPVVGFNGTGHHVIMLSYEAWVRPPAAPARCPAAWPH